MTKSRLLALRRRGAKAGALRAEDAGHDTRDTESLLVEFLSLLDATQEELNQRWSGQGNAACHTDRMRRG